MTLNLNAPSSVLLGAVAWRVEAMRDHREGRPNPHVERVDLARALPAWRAQARELLQELLARGHDLREVAYGGPDS